MERDEIERNAERIEKSLEEWDKNPPTFTNFYFHCGQEWQDPKCGGYANNDRCPVCNAEIEPYKTVCNETKEETIWADINKLKGGDNATQPPT